MGEGISPRVMGLSACSACRKPLQAEPTSYRGLDTYRSDLIERFWNFGVDYTKGHVLARYLTEATRNRPAYGWARGHRDDPGEVNGVSPESMYYFGTLPSPSNTAIQDRP